MNQLTLIPGDLLKIKLQESATTELDITVHYLIDNNGIISDENRQTSHSTGTALNTILSTPASGYKYIVKQITIYNPDGISHLPLLYFYDGSNNVGMSGPTATIATLMSWDSAGSSGGGGTTYTGTAPISVSGSVISLAPDTATAKTTLVGADEILSGDSVASFVPKKTTLTNLWANTVGVLIAALTAKTVPVFADRIEIADSAASNATKLVTFQNIFANLMLMPDGTMINGQISPSVASNKLTVALVAANTGSAATATNPIFVKLGGVIYSITAALSVTKNAGNEWFNAGLAEFATQGIDYFCLSRI